VFLPRSPIASVKAKIKDIKPGAHLPSGSGPDSAGSSGKSTKTQETLTKEIDETLQIGGPVCG